MCLNDIVLSGGSQWGSHFRPERSVVSHSFSQLPTFPKLPAFPQRVLCRPSSIKVCDSRIVKNVFLRFKEAEDFLAFLFFLLSFASSVRRFTPLERFRASLESTGIGENRWESFRCAFQQRTWDSQVERYTRKAKSPANYYHLLATKTWIIKQSKLSERESMKIRIFRPLFSRPIRCSLLRWPDRRLARWLGQRIDRWLDR